MDLSNLIVEFYERLSSWEEKTVEGTGLTLAQMHTVEILGINGDMRMKELAAKLGITTGSLTPGIDNLERKGLVKRIPNPSDRRSYLITLTPRGAAHHEEHHRAHIHMTEECLKDFSSQEQETFQNFLTRFLDKMD
ncbi:MAG: MarR family transcriptional regulator [Spirochaetales bacterium]|nr:MarR family transcriptional regulator [Spirochaetales bacterium]